MEVPNKPTVHSMKRRSFVHEYSHRGYFHITISTTGHLRQPLGRVCGDIDRTDGEAAAPHVELTPIGEMVKRELLHSITQHYPMVEVDTYVIMPEHLHILLHATHDIFSASGRRTHVGRVIAGFKQGCNRRYWEMTGLIPAATTSDGSAAGSTSNAAGNDASGTPASIASQAEQGGSQAKQGGSQTEQGGSQTEQGGSQAIKSPGAIEATAPQVTMPPAASSTTALGDSIAEPATSPAKQPATLPATSPATLPATQPAPSHAALPSLFQPGYCDVIPVDEAQLETQRAYIRNNPRSRLMRTSNRAKLMPRRGGIDTAVTLPAMCRFLRRECSATQFTAVIWEELQKRFLMENEYISCDSYGNRVLLEQRLLPVVCHRKDAGSFDIHKAKCLEAAAGGTVLVSARIARGEQEIMDAAMAAGYPVIRIIDNGLPERYHPSDGLVDACAHNLLLIVTPWHYQFRRKDDAIHVPFCKAMNCIAQALCRTADDWWKTNNDKPFKGKH